MSDTEIKRVGPNDTGLFLNVADDVFDDAIVPARLAAYLADPGTLMVLAVADGLTVGQCAAVLHRHPDKPTELYIDEVGVTPAFQRQGVARRMMDEIVAWGRELGCEEAWVGTEHDNIAAKALYARNADPAPFVMYQWDL